MWNVEQAKYEEQRRMMMFEQERIWKESERLAKEAALQKEAEVFANELLDDHHKELMGEAFGDAEKGVDEGGNEQENIKRAANDMIEVMMNDPDPKFRNSKFLQFLKKIDTGEYKIENNELLVDETKASGEKDPLDEAMNAAWEESKANFVPPGEREGEIASSKEAEEQKFMEDVFNEAKMKEMNENMTEDEMAKYFEEQYKQLMSHGWFGEESEDVLADAWQKAQNLEEFDLYRDASDKYNFANDNPYMGQDHNIQTGLQLLEKGKINDAIMALEAHLQQNDKDPVTWRILGKLHQENDQDQRAVPCLLKSFQLDPSNLDTLLTLGVSCTNILDEVKAMNFIKIWLLSNPNYANKGLVDPNLISEEKLEGDWDVKEIKQINETLLDAFQKAVLSNPNDPSLFNCLAVLHFIARDYENAVECFKISVKHDPMNHSLWNKLGATLAHLNRTDEAIEAYNRALELKPNYVRVWVNLGIAYSTKKDHEESARFFLTGLSLNPNARHVWTFLHTVFTMMERRDLLLKLKNHNVDDFREEFELVSLDDLPNPELEYQKLNQKFLIQADAEKWMEEIMKQQGCCIKMQQHQNNILLYSFTIICVLYCLRVSFVVCVCLCVCVCCLLYTSPSPRDQA
eukprot:TRINITY_DN785_c0_g8_i1.p1 TRINITY_DN785_c0_g8~~TRINITY_DN785_c0_g8_i1.p1  ORF type:complete len:741 (-),score=247.46 TRINITY_DN785_c0_g8_i1:79-1968(-)